MFLSDRTVFDDCIYPNKDERIYRKKKKKEKERCQSPLYHPIISPIVLPEQERRKRGREGFGKCVKEAMEERMEETVVEKFIVAESQRRTTSWIVLQDAFPSSRVLIVRNASCCRAR